MKSSGQRNGVRQYKKSALPRRQWTPELHEHFVDTVEHLGGRFPTWDYDSHDIERYTRAKFMDYTTDNMSIYEVAITSSGVKKGELLVADVNTQPSFLVSFLKFKLVCRYKAIGIRLDKWRVE
nr:putative two-component response regulator ARR20 [Ipomoea trifida]